MFFIDRLDLDRRFRVLRRELGVRGISEELRGWSFEEAPVQPPGEAYLLSVSELAGRYCSTLRDIYLRRILMIRPPPNVKLIRGLTFHRVCYWVLFEVKRIIFEKGGCSGFDIVKELLLKAEATVKASLEEAGRVVGEISETDRVQLESELLSLYRFLVIQAAAKVDLALSKYPHATPDSIVNIAVPPVVERRVDGSLVGLSRELSVDIYTPYNAVADLKTGEVRSFHPLTVAGYALALEAEENIPVDYGVIIYVHVVKGAPRFRLRCFTVTDELRREFLELRDEAYELLVLGRDPGKPSRCPSYCPYYKVCRVENV